MRREAVLMAAFEAGYRAPSAPSLFAEGPVAAAATRAARGIAAMLAATGRQVPLDEILRVWPFVEVCVPTTGVAALDGMELHLANMCAELALPAIGLHDVLRPLYDVTGDADDEQEYRREVTALADPALARYGYDGGAPAYRAARARLVDVLLADYHRVRIAAIDRCLTEIAPGMDTGRWGVLSAIRAEARWLATAGAHLRALRPDAEAIAACARAVPALAEQAKRRAWLDTHARVTLVIWRAYHARRLAALGAGGEAQPDHPDDVMRADHSATSPRGVVVSSAIVDALATEDGRRVLLDSIDRALACAEPAVGGAARYRVTEVGITIERTFFLERDDPLLPALVSATRRAVAPLAGILAPWLGA